MIDRTKWPWHRDKAAGLDHFSFEMKGKGIKRGFPIGTVVLRDENAFSDVTSPVLSREFGRRRRRPV